MAFAEVASSTYRKYIRLYGCYRRLESIFSVRRYRGERRENIAVGVPMTGGAPRQGLAMPPPHPPPPIHLITTAKPRHFIWHTDHPVWYVTHTIPYRICDVRYHYDTHTLKHTRMVNTMTHAELKTTLANITAKAPALTSTVQRVAMFITPSASNLFAQTQVKSIITAAAIEQTTGRMDAETFMFIAESLKDFKSVTWVDASPVKVADPVADTVKMALDYAGLKRF